MKTLLILLMLALTQLTACTTVYDADHMKAYSAEQDRLLAKQEQDVINKYEGGHDINKDVQPYYNYIMNNGGSTGHSGAIHTGNSAGQLTPTQVTIQTNTVNWSGSHE